MEVQGKAFAASGHLVNVADQLGYLAVGVLKHRAFGGRDETPQNGSSHCLSFCLVVGKGRRGQGLAAAVR